METINNVTSLHSFSKYIENINKIKVSFDFVDSGNNVVCSIATSYSKNDISDKIYDFIIGNSSSIDLKKYKPGFTIRDKYCAFNDILKKYLNSDESFLIISKIKNAELVAYDEKYNSNRLQFSKIPCFIGNEKRTSTILKINFTIKLAAIAKQLS